MNKTQINERLELLFWVLQYSSQECAKFRPGERILINQECGQLLYALDFPKVKLRPVPDSIEVKIKEIQREIDRRDWQPLNKVRFTEPPTEKY